MINVRSRRKKVAIKIDPHKQFPEIYWVSLEDQSRRLATKNLVPGREVYGERLVWYLDKEYRIWDSFRSKFSAAILKGLETVSIQPRHKVLYLGAASGTTASHISDIIGEKGYLYCVEFAPRTIRELINNVCEYRSNISPILADARFPEKYVMLAEKVDDIYCDIAQRQQAKILADNADLFLKTGGYIMLAIKARSIDVTKKPSEIFKKELRLLMTRGFCIKSIINLEPYDKDHAMIVAMR